MSENEKYALEMKNITKEHHEWMKNSINLIASENISSRDVREALASHFSHRYAEGLPCEKGCTRAADTSIQAENLTIDLSKGCMMQTMQMSSQYLV